MIKRSGSLCSIDEDIPFVMETEDTHVSEFTKAATLNQAGRLIFLSRSISCSAKHRLSIEKEAYATNEGVRKWKHFLTGRYFQNNH